MPSLVTLTTDFGTRDPYVGAVKGVISNLCPQARIVDLSHSITRHNVTEASLFLLASVPFFPPGSIHLVVVDPGVGTERKPIVVSSLGRLFVCPDNGLLTFFVQRHGYDEIRLISNRDCMLAERSATFDGRDLFAPTSARLACGFPLSDVGPPLQKMEMLPLRRVEQTDVWIRGVVIHVDAFGNLITNIPQSVVTGVATIVLKDIVLTSIGKTYSSVAPGEFVALWGSSGFLEIAVNRGSAADLLDSAVGDVIKVYRTPRRNAASERRV